MKILAKEVLSVCSSDKSKKEDSSDVLKSICNQSSGGKISDFWSGKLQREREGCFYECKILMTKMLYDYLVWGELPIWAAFL